MAGGAVGPVQQHIHSTVQGSELKPVHLEVENESHGRHEDESHFHVLVVSESFEGMTPIKRHRAVQALLTDDTGKLPFHSLRLTTKTPAQYGVDPSAPAAPKCTGKGDGRGPSDLAQELKQQ
jgi:BolA protein